MRECGTGEVGPCVCGRGGRCRQGFAWWAEGRKRGPEPQPGQKLIPFLNFPSPPPQISSRAGCLTLDSSSLPRRFFQRDRLLDRSSEETEDRRIIPEEPPSRSGCDRRSLDHSAGTLSDHLVVTQLCCATTPPRDLESPSLLLSCQTSGLFLCGERSCETR